MPFPTDTDICNLALSRIGQWRITDIYLDSEIERHCRLHLPQVRRSLLRRHAWNFAVECPELAANAAPGFQDMRRFDLPADYLQALAIYSDVDRECAVDRFKVEKKTVIAATDTAWLEYVADICDPADWSADFTECVVLKLGSRLCIPLGAPPSRGDALLQELEQLALPEATLNNAWEDSSGENNPTAERIAQSGFVRASQFHI